MTVLPNQVPAAPGASLLTQTLAAWTGAAVDLWQSWSRRGVPASRGAEVPSGRHLAAIVALVLCAAFVAFAIFADEPIARAAQTLSPQAKQVFQQITKIGESGWLFALSAVVGLGALACTGHGGSTRTDAGLRLLAGRACFVFAVNAVAGIASQVLKHLVGRARPKYIDIVGPFHFDLFAVRADFASFPSGHTITVFATAVAVAWFAPRLRWPLLGIATLVAISRVAIGAHYPSDVIAGLVVGWASALVLARVCGTRRIVFTRSPGGGVRPRGAGLVWPAVRAIAGRPSR